MTQTDVRQNNFDLLRLLAATQVVFHHGMTHLNVPIPWLSSVLNFFPGVPIFFALSGFLISLSLERNPQLMPYARNRFLRIYPALWVCFIISVITVALVRGSVFEQAGLSQVIVWVLAQLSIVQFYNPDFLRGYGVGVLNGSLWTIPVELQFYIVLPVLYLGLGWHKHKRDLSLIVLTLLMGGVYWHYTTLRTEGEVSTLVRLYQETLAPHLYMFLAGVLLQRHFRRIWPWLHNKVLLWLGVYVFTALVTQWLGLGLINPISFIPLAFFILACAYTLPLLSHQLLRGNDISYGTYIYHMIVINAMVELGYLGRFYYLGIVLSITFVLAYLSWRIVEKPALALKRISQKPLSSK
jgi:peptidoglycan/LPS O-acetylase OafA/YrhL